MAKEVNGGTIRPKNNILLSAGWLAFTAGWIYYGGFTEGYKPCTSDKGLRAQ